MSIDMTGMFSISSAAPGMQDDFCSAIGCALQPWLTPRWYHRLMNFTLTGMIPAAVGISESAWRPVPGPSSLDVCPPRCRTD